MKERDYILITALQRLRSGRTIIHDSLAHHVDPKMEVEWKASLRRIDGMIERLEKMVDREMEAV